MADATFDADWLASREPVDHRARSGALARALAEAGARRGWRSVVDLGGGTGSNLRYLRPRLPWARRWTVVDHDASLLARVERVPGLEIETVEADLAGAGLDAVADADVVTASALLDLVSASWMERLATRCRAASSGVLLALSYDGRWVLDPPHPDDGWVRESVNRHQRRDKGLGAALGPDAADAARVAFTAAGYRVRLADSPWNLPPGAHRSLARRLVEGWATAAAEATPDRAECVARWRTHRIAAVEEAGLAIEVGHRDLLALPEVRIDGPGAPTPASP